MMIVVDSREKWTQPGSTDRHLPDYFDRHGVEYTVRKLDTGDYMLEGQPGIVIDRKQSLQECAQNLLNRKDSSRFWREVRRAHEQKIKLIVLVESGTVKNINEVAKWKSKYSPVTGRRLVEEMIRVEHAYGVTWRFCSRRSTARLIVEILTGNEK